MHQKSHWDAEWDRQNLLSFRAMFCPFTSPLLNDPKYQYFEKNGKNARILSFYTYMCTINEAHMIYGTWNIWHYRHKFSTFSAIFCPFSPLITWKIKILTPSIKRGHKVFFLPFYPSHNPKNQDFKKMKKATRDIIILHMCTQNYDHMMHSSWNMVQKGRTDRRSDVAGTLVTLNILLICINQ